MGGLGREGRIRSFVCGTKTGEETATSAAGERRSGSASKQAYRAGRGVERYRRGKEEETWGRVRIDRAPARPGKGGKGLHKVWSSG